MGAGSALSIQSPPAPAGRIIFGRAYFRSLIARASEVTGIPESDIKSPCRQRDVSWCRFAIMAAARSRGFSCQRIAHELGMTDHTSVVHGKNRAAALVEMDSDFAMLARELRGVTQ